MFKDYYKKAWDSVEPRKDLMAQILNDAENRNKNIVAFPKKQRKNIFKYTASVAAAFVICAATVLYPQLEKTHNDYTDTLNKAANVENIQKVEISEQSTDIGDNSENANVGIVTSDIGANNSVSENPKINKSVNPVAKSEKSEKSDLKTDTPVVKSEAKTEAISYAGSAESIDELPKTDSTHDAASIANVQTEPDTAAELPASYSLTPDESEKTTTAYSGAKSAPSQNDKFEFATEAAENIIFTPTEKSALTKAEALELAASVVDEYDETHIFCDDTNSIWRVDFVLNHEVVKTVYVTFDGEIGC